jgi:hypothetical protein
MLSLAAATETNWLLLLFLILSSNQRNGQNHAVIFVYFCLFLSFSVLITIGYQSISAIVLQKHNSPPSFNSTFLPDKLAKNKQTSFQQY